MIFEPSDEIFTGCFYGKKMGVNTAIILQKFGDFSGINSINFTLKP